MFTVIFLYTRNLYFSQTALSLTQKNELHNFMSKLHEEKSTEIADQVMKEVKAKGEQLFRKVTTVLNFRALDATANADQILECELPNRTKVFIEIFVPFFTYFL